MKKPVPFEVLKVGSSYEVVDFDVDKDHSPESRSLTNILKLPSLQ